MFFTVALLLLGTQGSVAEGKEKICCSPSFNVSLFAMNVMYPSAFVYDNVTGNRILTTTDADNNDITIFLTPKELRQYTRTRGHCVWTPAPILENGNICVNGDAVRRGEYNIEGRTYYHYTQSVGNTSLADEFWVDGDCVPKISLMSLNGQPVVYSVFFDVQVLKDGSAANKFDTKGCVKGPQAV